MRRLGILALLVSQLTCLYAQKESEMLPATKRSIINNKWHDRAQISGQSLQPAGQYVLWYRQPAKVWEEALPVGNGSLGAMIFGGVSDERIQLNESSLWDGNPVDAANPRSLEALPTVRKLLFENKNNEAVELAAKTMMGNPSGIKSYQSLGELWFETPITHAEDYTRSLDLATAISSVSFKANDVLYKRENFSSGDSKVVVVHFTADKKNKISFTLTLKRQENAVCIADVSDSKSILLKGALPSKDATGKWGGLHFATKVKAVNNGGTVTVTDGLLKVVDATEVTLYISGATNYPGLQNLAKGIVASQGEAPEILCGKTIEAALKKTYAQLKKAHIESHQQLFSRVQINLASADDKDANLSTDELLAKAKSSGNLPARLVEIFFQYGRYLLISSSRPGGMPANLQGLWAWQMDPPWNADFHTNINVQMNYWPAEITNLPELHRPLFDLQNLLAKTGGKTAKTMYGAEGWVVHHLTDAWGFTAPADGPQGIWPMGAAWLARHPWEHYCYSQDTAFLRRQAYPLMKGAALFILDFLVKAPEGTACAGKLVTNPSYSPENSFKLPDGSTAVFTYGATMDLQIIHDLLTNCIDAANILGTDETFRNKCQTALQNLAPVRISSATGRVMEWAEDYAEVEPHHRHTSHLYGLYPGNQITTEGTPELAAAARKTLEARGDDGTGWSLAWKINMWNRLHDGDHAYKLLTVLLATKTLGNLFDNHPPFQIDGNFGATASIAEMFLQSQGKTKDSHYIVELLPSLPAALADGNVSGLCAAGGFVADIAWKNSKATKITVTSKAGGELNLRLGSITTKFNTKAGEVIQLDKDLKKI